MIVTVPASVEEFYNKNHSPSNGRFTSGKSIRPVKLKNTERVAEWKKSVEKTAKGDKKAKDAELIDWKKARANKRYQDMIKRSKLP